MYRLPVRLSGHILLLLAALLGAPAAAHSTTNLMIGRPPAALVHPSDALSLQQELHSFGGINTGNPWSIARTPALSFDVAFGVDATVARIALQLQPGQRLLSVQSIATAPRTVRELSKAATLDTAPPMPTALWILGTGMIGLSAVGRRRAQPFPVAP